MPSNLGPAPCDQSASSCCLRPLAHPERSEERELRLQHYLSSYTEGRWGRRETERESWPAPVAASRGRLHMLLSFKPRWSYPLVNMASQVSWMHQLLHQSCWYLGKGWEKDGKREKSPVTQKWRGPWCKLDYDPIWEIRVKLLTTEAYLFPWQFTFCFLPKGQAISRCSTAEPSFPVRPGSQ